jgi:hypothetical protein
MRRSLPSALMSTGKRLSLTCVKSSALFATGDRLARSAMAAISSSVSTSRSMVSSSPARRSVSR